MKSAKAELEEHARQILAGRLALVTPKQREFFDRLFPRGVPSAKLETAIDLCNRTIAKNAAKAAPEKP